VQPENKRGAAVFRTNARRHIVSRDGVLHKRRSSFLNGVLLPLGLFVPSLSWLKNDHHHDLFHLKKVDGKKEDDQNVPGDSEHLPAKNTHIHF
jgi:hypothetical protein